MCRAGASSGGQKHTWEISPESHLLLKYWAFYVAPLRTGDAFWLICKSLCCGRSMQVCNRMFKVRRPLVPPVLVSHVSEESRVWVSVQSVTHLFSWRYLMVSRSPWWENIITEIKTHNAHCLILLLLTFLPPPSLPAAGQPDHPIASQ